MRTYRYSSREDWLQTRRSGIGGSDVASILGLSPWKTAVQTWAEKKGAVVSQEETEAMRFGSYAEEYVARRYTEETGNIVRKSSFMFIDDIFIANIDRLVCRKGRKVAMARQKINTNKALECKTSGDMGWDEVPAYYETQVQHYMGVLPMLESFDFGVLFCGKFKKYATYHIDKNQETIDGLREILRDWWNQYIIGSDKPKPDNEDDCRILWSRSNGRQIVADFSTAEIVEKLRDIKREQDELDATESALKAVVKEYVKDNEALTDIQGNVLVSYKNDKDSIKVDWEAVAAELNAPEDVIKKHSSVRPGARKFILKKEK